MNLIFGILFVMSIIFCVIATLCVIGFALIPQKMGYRKRSIFIEQEYFDFMLFREGIASYKNLENKPWDDLDDKLSD